MKFGNSHKEEYKKATYVRTYVHKLRAKVSELLHMVMGISKINKLIGFFLKKRPRQKWLATTTLIALFSDFAFRCCINQVQSYV